MASGASRSIETIYEAASVVCDSPPGIAVLYSEFESSQDTIWLVPLSNRLEPEPPNIAVIPHVPLCGMRVALSPRSQQVGLRGPPTRCPGPGASRRCSGRRLGTSRGRRRTALPGADVRIAPIWSPDSRTLVFQRFSQVSNSPTPFRVNIGDERACVPG